MPFLALGICRVILTSIYKDAFTTEIIMPFKRSLTWRHVYELGDERFKIFLPLSPDDVQLEDFYLNGTKITNLLVFDFSMDMQKIAGHVVADLQRLLGYKRFAKALLDKLMGKVEGKMTSA